MKNEADESMFVNCRFIGNQDTLYANKNKQYYYNCYIEGDVDFIFGGATAVFENCEVFSANRDGITPKGYIAAPSTLKEDKFGYLFLDCKLNSNITEKESVYLGRPWHPTSEKRPMISSVVYRNCDMGSHISSEGWSKMSNDLPQDNDMFEYGSKGEGAKNSNTRRVLTEEQAKDYSKENYLKNWDTNKRFNQLKSYSS